MRRELLGYAIGMNFCNTEALINKHGCMCNWNEHCKVFKTKELAQSFIDKRAAINIRDKLYIREYYHISFPNSNITAGNIACAITGLKH